MNPSNIDRLYQYQRPFDGICDHCGTDSTLFYETPGGDQLCNDCGARIFDSFRARDIGSGAVEPLENDPEPSQPSKDDNPSHLEELLTQVQAAQYRGGIDPDIIEFEYSQILWEEVDQSTLVNNGVLVVDGRYSYGEVPVEGFQAVHRHFDPSVGTPNDVFLTDNGVYVYEWVAEEVSSRDLAPEILRVLREEAREGRLEGLRPVEEVAPPPDCLYERLERHHDVESFNIHGESEVRSVTLRLHMGRDQDKLLQEIRTVNGIEYPKPDKINIDLG